MTSSVVRFRVEFFGRARPSILWIIGFIAIDLVVGCRATGTSDGRPAAHSGASAASPAATDLGDSEESALGLDWELIDQAVEPPTWTMMTGCLIQEYPIDIYCQDAWVRHDRNQRQARGDAQFEDRASRHLDRIWGNRDLVAEEREAKRDAEIAEMIRQNGPIPKATQ